MNENNTEMQTNDDYRRKKAYVLKNTQAVAPTNAHVAERIALSYQLNVAAHRRLVPCHAHNLRSMNWNNERKLCFRHR